MSNQEINIDEYNELLASGNMGMVLISATWCNPCTQFKPQVTQLAKDNDLTFHLLDADKSNVSGVESIPTLILYKDGKVVKQLSGVKANDEVLKVYKELAGK